MRVRKYRTEVSFDWWHDTQTLPADMFWSYAMNRDARCRKVIVDNASSLEIRHKMVLANVCCEACLENWTFSQDNDTLGGCLELCIGGSHFGAHIWPIYPLSSHKNSTPEYSQSWNFEGIYATGTSNRAAENDFCKFCSTILIALHVSQMTGLLLLLLILLLFNAYPSDRQASTHHHRHQHHLFGVFSRIGNINVCHRRSGLSSARINLCHPVVLCLFLPESDAYDAWRHFCQFLPRCMKCRRGLAMRILSVRLSVCPSVRPSVCLSDRRVICDKMEERSVQIFIPYERTFILIFWEDRMVGGGRFLLREILGQPTPIGTKSPIFNQ